MPLDLDLRSDPNEGLFPTMTWDFGQIEEPLRGDGGHYNGSYMVQLLTRTGRIPATAGMAQIGNGQMSGGIIPSKTFVLLAYVTSHKLPIIVASLPANWRHLVETEKIADLKPGELILQSGIRQDPDSSEQPINKQGGMVKVDEKGRVIIQTRQPGVDLKITVGNPSETSTRENDSQTGKEIFCEIEVEGKGKIVIDSDGSVIIESGKVLLGENATEQLIKGNELFQQLNAKLAEIVTQFNSHAHATAGLGPPSAPIPVVPPGVHMTPKTITTNVLSGVSKTE